MANQRVAIEQMFEDIPNTTFNTAHPPHAPHHQMTAPAQKLETKDAGAMKPGSAKKKASLSVPAEVSSASSVTVFLDTSDESKAAVDQARGLTTSARRKSAGGGGVAGSVSGGVAGSVTMRASGSSTRADKMTSMTALAMYSDKLTPYERVEIKGYPTVYFLGVGAKKRQGEGITQKTASATYDDEEHFYHVVSRDHVAYRYEVADKPSLGKGTFGQVIKAYDHKDQRWVALKLVRNEKVYLNQSKEELRILQVLQKQDTHGIFNVIKLYDFFVFRNHMVFSFELLGMNLYQVLKRNNYKGLAQARIVPIARAVLKCLELLFRNRIVHCDVKPENIMLRKNGDVTSVKVGDFGSSCYEQQQKYHYIQSRYYRAPEVMLGLRYGPAIDMWSFGCVLGELATGAPIFVGEDEEDQLCAVAEAIGDIPASLLNRTKSHSKALVRRKDRGRPGSKPLAATLDGDGQFKDAVTKILEWDPEVRPTPLEIQQHPWLVGSRSKKTATDAARRSSTLQRGGEKPSLSLSLSTGGTSKKTTRKS